MTGETVRRGRPTETDPETLALVALRLFRERGFDSVTLDDIGREAGVARRTLTRYFASKSDLIWSGLPQSGERLANSLAAADPHSDAVATLIQAMASSLEPHTTQSEVNRERLRLIGREPSLLAAARPVFADGERAAVDFLASRGWREPISAEVLVTALFAAMLTAAVGWAITGSDSLEHAVRREMRTLIVTLRTVHIPQD